MNYNKKITQFALPLIFILTGSIALFSLHQAIKSGFFYQQKTIIFALVTGFLVGVTISSLLWRRKGIEETHLLKKHQEIINEIEDGYYEVDLSGKTLFANDGIRKIFGYSREEVLLMDNRDYMTPENAAKIFKAFNEVYKTGIPAKGFAYEIIHKDGTPRVLETSITLMKNHNEIPTGFRGITRDISHRRLTEETLRKAKEEAEAASQAKSMFLANMSHEIRTPMSGVIGMTKLLMDTDLSEEQMRYLRLINNCGENLLDVINDILDFSKIEAHQLIISSEEFDPCTIIMEVIGTLILKTAEKGIELVSEKSGEIPDILVGDAVRIRQILMNLAGNAVKFTDNGRIIIRLECIERQDGFADMVFSVQDTGIGIDPEKIDGLFSPFTQVDGSITREYGGTGLGLAISGELASLMNGKIEVKSKPSEGSMFSFHIRLPFRKKYSGDYGQPEEEKQNKGTKPDTDYYKNQLSVLAKKLGKEKFEVLLAEDHPVNRELCEKMLSKIGISAITARNGKEALEKIGGGIYDLIIMDVQMPHLSGIEATKMIREPIIKTGNENTPIIALTAHAMTGDRERCLMAGMDDYISKPISANLLYASLLKALSQKAGSNSPDNQR